MKDQKYALRSGGGWMGGTRRQVDSLGYKAIRTVHLGESIDLVSGLRERTSQSQKTNVLENLFPDFKESFHIPCRHWLP